MDPIGFLRQVASQDWRFTPEGVAQGMHALGYGPPRPDGDGLHFDHPDRPVRARPGPGPESLESLAWTVRTTPDPAGLEEADWDEAVEDLERQFLDWCREAAVVLGKPEHFGATRGPTWCSWDDLHALWARPTAWIMLQLRQDDTDVPAEVAVVWTEPGRFRPALGTGTIPERTGPHLREPRSMQEMLNERGQEAHALRQAGRFPEALDRYAEIVRAAPFFAAAWYDYSCCLLDAGQPKDALDALERTLEEDGQFLGRVTLKRLDALRALGGLKANYERLVARVQAQPPDPRACYELALMMQRQGHEALTRSLLEQFVRLAPEAYAHDRARMAAWLAGG